LLEAVRTYGCLEAGYVEARGEWIRLCGRARTHVLACVELRAKRTQDQGIASATSIGQAVWHDLKYSIQNFLLTSNLEFSTTVY
jgi:hypothetical protein